MKNKMKNINFIKKILKKHGNMSISSAVLCQGYECGYVKKVYITINSNFILDHDATIFDVVAFETRKEAEDHIKFSKKCNRDLSLVEGIYSPNPKSL